MLEIPVKVTRGHPVPVLRIDQHAPLKVQFMEFENGLLNALSIIYEDHPATIFEIVDLKLT
jgi:hypothetical protein